MSTRVANRMGVAGLINKATPASSSSSSDGAHTRLHCPWHEPRDPSLSHTHPLPHPHTQAARYSLDCCPNCSRQWGTMASWQQCCLLRRAKSCGHTDAASMSQLPHLLLFFFICCFLASDAVNCRACLVATTCTRNLLKWKTT